MEFPGVITIHKGDIQVRGEGQNVIGQRSSLNILAITFTHFPTSHIDNGR